MPHRRNIIRIFVVACVLLGSLSVALLAHADDTQPPWPPKPSWPPIVGPHPQSDEALVVRLYVDRVEQLADILPQLDVWEQHPEDLSVVAAISIEQYHAFVAADYRLEIDEEKTALLRRPLRTIPAGAESIPAYACYRTVEETLSTGQTLATTYPTLTQWIDIGDSWEKTMPGGLPGYDLMVLKLTNSVVPGPKPKAFIMSGIHAREYAPQEFNTRFAEYLLSRYGSDADITGLLDFYEIHLLLSTNPDGRKHAETGVLWRKNTNQNYCGATSSDRGADLNRNFSFQWNCCGGSSSDPCSEDYHGASAGSEPETNAIQNYVRAEFPDQRAPDLTAAAPLTSTGIFLDLHSYGGDVMWSWGFTPNAPPNGTQLQTLGRKMAYFNGYSPHQSYTMYATDGTTKDFGYGDLGMAGYTIEMGTDFFQDCATFENSIWPDNLPAILYATKATRRPYQLSAGPDSLSVTVTPTQTATTRVITLTATANDARYSNANGTEPTQNISAARYTVDAPSWFTGVISYPLSAVDGSFNNPIENVIATIDTTGWSTGRHSIFVESQDAAGNWGVPTAVFVWVTAEPDSTIRGTVRAVDGRTLAAASVRLTGQGQNLQQTTHADGNYAFAVFSGTYALTVTAHSYYPQVTAPIVVPSGLTVTQDITLTAIPSGTLTGVVRQAITLLPLAAEIKLVSPSSIYQVSTAPIDGHYALAVLSDTYTVTIQSDGHQVAIFHPIVISGQQTTTLDAVLSPETCLLLIDDDGGRSYETYYQTALSQVGVSYQQWNVAAQGDPSSAMLTPYAAVIWFTGDDSPYTTLNANNRAQLTAYLQQGGHLWLTGTDIGAGNQNQSFYTQTLSTRFTADDSSVKTLNGSGPFNSLTVALNGGDGANNQTFPDALAPRGNAWSVFTYTNGLPGGVALDTGLYRILNFGFGLEGISTAANRRQVLQNGLAWLGCPVAPHQWRIDKVASSPTLWTGEQLTYTLHLSHTSLLTATGVIITDALPLHLSFVSASHSGTLANEVVSWGLPQVGPTQTLELTLTVQASPAPSGTQVVNASYGVRSDQTEAVAGTTPVITTLLTKLYRVHLPIILK